MALALRTLCGLSTREIARAFLEPEATTAQRLVRAKRKILDARIPFEVPARELLPERLSTVLGVVYLVFNEGYASTEADGLVRTDLCSEAIRLGRLLVELLPEEPEAQGLLALMLLHDARRATRIDAAGALVPLEEQDRGRWQRDAIAEGLATLQAALCTASPRALPAAGGDRRAPRRGRACASHRLGADRGALRRPAARAAEPRGRAQRGGGPGDGARPGAGPVLDRSPRPGRSARRLSPPAGRPRGLLRRLGRLSEAALSYQGGPRLVSSPAERLYLERRLAACIGGSSPAVACGKAPDCGLPQGCKARLGPE
jgi:RNA polymerase sigma-70 factor (ECF subfamily)